MLSIKGASLAQNLNNYSFFSYNTSEALHLSEHERQLVLNCFSKIEYELQHAIDKHSKQLIASNIELLLNYCVRFYDRQFITRDNVNRGILEKFEELLNGLFLIRKEKIFNSDRAINEIAFELGFKYPQHFSRFFKKVVGQSLNEYRTASLN